MATAAADTAMARAVKTTGLPIQMLAEDIREEPLDLEILVDNSAAESLGKSGISKQLKYLAKHVRVRVGFVRDTLLEHGGPTRVVKRTPTEQNTADVLTKPLGREKHEMHIKAYGIKSFKEYQQEFPL